MPVELPTKATIADDERLADRRRTSNKKGRARRYRRSSILSVDKLSIVFASRLGRNSAVDGWTPIYPHLGVINVNGLASAARAPAALAGPTTPPPRCPGVATHG
ncbi:hypothetical protein EVAR_48511_1 [Eumeta japonica]|uniref:Uncharacterized protein n=1 Tax=Eumeta variegata TaxID=151549 RepID=A0A4C1Z4Q7_EUMVA|nr:hypothetical protein EVAR_48511_1 [Eumeta japonica]